MKREWFLLLALLFVLAWAHPTEATLQANKTFKETYPGKETTYYKCSLCHTGAIGKKGEINPYGQSLKLEEGTLLTADQLKAAETLDPDSDSVPSGKEIEGNTLPGDPASHP